MGENYLWKEHMRKMEEKVGREWNCLDFSRPRLLRESFFSIASSMINFTKHAHPEVLCQSMSWLSVEWRLAVQTST